MTIYAATTNAGKLREFAKSASDASGTGVTVVALPNLREMPEPVEDAATFMSNAELKAVAYSRLAPGLLVMADDSGLAVDALGGAPGVRSVRFAEDYEAAEAAVEPTSQTRDVGHPAKGTPPFPIQPERMGHPVAEPSPRDARNNALLLRLLAQSDAERGARYVCALTVARDGKVVWGAEEACEGEILDAPRGDGGFGYDPLFFVPQFGRSMAELSPEEKWSVSHRGKAFRALLAQIAPLRTHTR